MSASTTDPLIGRLIDGRYQVRSRIARGGMATVYLATDLRLERRVAVKVMHGHLADDSQFKQRFIQEARSAARLAHPNVVNVFDQGQDSESAYLVMEYLPGITLRDLLEEYGSLTPQQTIDIAEAVLAGLAAAHKAGIIHRDLKPENVLLADDGRIKIGDFGLARAASANTATGAQLLGTIAYLSPELVTRGVADTRSDIYAVGIMMYEMLTGEQPFTGEQPMQIAYRHANEPVPPPSDRNPRVPRELDELVLWSTAKDPDQRPADARALLDQVRDTESVLDLPPTTGPTRAFTQVLPPAPAGPRHTTGPTRPNGATGPTRPDRPSTTDAATQVLAPRRGAGVPAGELALAEPRVAPNRRPRRWIPLVAVLAVLALVGGTLGWWFGFGPGSRVTIPESLEGATVEEARDILTDLGLTVSEQLGESTHPTVPLGDIAATEPELGAAVERGSSVTLLVSIGPKLLDIHLERGMTESAAIEVVESAWTLEETIPQFDTEVPAGQLIDALGSDDASLLAATQYGELQPITLIVSAGPVPPVAGLTIDEARTALAAVQLTVDDGREERNYDGAIPEGSVIGLVDHQGPLRPGDSVGLNVSRGPEMIVIPNVVDRPWLEAKQMLEAAGFAIDFVNGNSRTIANSIPGLATLRAIEPDEGESAPKGSTVLVRLSAG